MKFCPNCGAKLEEGVKFCIECGTKVVRPELPAYESPAEPVYAPPVPPESPVKPVYAPQSLAKGGTGPEKKSKEKTKDAEDVKGMIARDNQLRLALQFVKTLPVLKELQK